MKRERSEGKALPNIKRKLKQQNSDGVELLVGTLKEEAPLEAAGKHVSEGFEIC